MIINRKTIANILIEIVHASITTSKTIYHDSTVTIVDFLINSDALMKEVEFIFIKNEENEEWVRVLKSPYIIFLSIEEDKRDIIVDENFFPSINNLSITFFLILSKMYEHTPKKPMNVLF